MTTSYEQLVVVSGASTGMGTATARELASRGFHVLAGVRTAKAAEQIRGQRLEPIILDITDPEHVAAIGARVQDDGRPLRALINNAGMAANAPIETLPLPVWRQMFEVNLFGHIAMTQQLLPALRASKGTVVSISSTGGKIAMPAFGAYSATKYAVEAVSDALRRELAGQGVKVVIIEPGAVKTEMVATGTRTAHQLIESMSEDDRARYDELIRAFLAQTAEFGRSGVPATRAARTIADAATAAEPKTRYTIGRDAAIFTRLARVVSDRALDRALASTARRALRTAS